MKIKINYNNDKLFCLYSKEKIEFGDKYVEVIEQYLNEEIIKTYAYWYLDVLVDEYLENYNEAPEIEMDF